MAVSSIHPKDAPVTQAYTHGMASGELGPGGYDVVVQTPTTRVTRCWGYHRTTRDRMAIITATIALQQSPPSYSVQLHTDSRRVFDALHSEAIQRWRRDGWKARVGRKPVKDNDFWRQLLVAYEQRTVELVLLPRNSKAEGHAECIRLAKAAAVSPVKSIDPLYRKYTNQYAIHYQQASVKETTISPRAGDRFTLLPVPNFCRQT